MKKTSSIFFIIVSTTLAFSQNYFPVKAGDTLLYRRQTVSELYWDRYIKQIVVEAEFDSLKYFNVYEHWYRYDQPNQKLYTIKNGEALLSADFNAPAGTFFIGTIMDLTYNFKSEGANDSMYYALADSIPYPGIHLTHVFRFKKDLGYVYDEEYNRTSQYMSDVEYDLLEARGSSYSLSIAKPTLTVNNVPDTKKLNEFPFSLNMSITHAYPKLIDSLCVFIELFRNDTLKIQKVWQDLSKTYFLIDLTPQQLQVGDLIRLKFLLSDSSLSCNKIWLPLTGTYNIMVADPTDIKNENLLSYSLNQNYPNPFNPTTNIVYSLKRSGIVKLTVYDILGREVSTLVNGYKELGEYSVNFSAENIPSGNYFYSLSVTTDDGFNSQKFIKKMTVIK